MTFCMAPKFFCRSLFLLQNKWYRHLQGIEGTISLTHPNLSTRLLYATASALEGSCESQEFHK